uniref:Endonuclease/exonuclease/phosphatase domain-containing protein n=1 Tax=Lactuca sativa TaxID=4236 RepID=A0A9R1XCL7_LACSA|nr:hypothetical protein LSAT_V11C500264230 [Lactuca sativa]
MVHTLLKGLEKIVASADIPMLVCGDFNSVPGRYVSFLLHLLCVLCGQQTSVFITLVYVELYGLLEGLDIAVKHLSKTSRQGLDEYKLAMFYLIWT